MGQIIPQSAAPERISDDFAQTLANARLREAPIKEVAEARLAALESPIDQAETACENAEKLAAERHTKLQVQDHTSDIELGTVIDEAWNALGRPASSVDYALIVGSGKTQWTDGDPLEQPALMKVLAKNLRNTTSPALQSRKEEWALRIEEKAAAHESLVEPTRSADTALFVAQAQLRSLTRLAQVALTRLKRDFKNLGLSEAQIHQIIPDYVPRPRGPKAPTNSELPQ